MTIAPDAALLGAIETDAAHQYLTEAAAVGLLEAACG